MVDKIYIAASQNDARFTRICVASVRYFYPDILIQILVGGPLQPGLASELQKFWNVSLADFPRGNWGWGFVKLEPLFGQSTETFLVLDSDTAVVGDVLQNWFSDDVSFLMDDEEQSESDTKSIYYDWQQSKAAGFDTNAPRFVANTGQWFGTSGVLKRKDFTGVIDWGTMPPRIIHPDFFKNGEQGAMNFVLNQKVSLNEVKVALRKIMRWPGHGMNGISAKSISDRTAPPVVVHWAGLKRHRIKDMPGADVLHFFEVMYYKNTPFGGVIRYLRAASYTWLSISKLISQKLKHRVKKLIKISVLWNFLAFH